MSKMNFKSTLWALAFACAAVSCSDELADGPNNNEGNEQNGESAQIKVLVNMGMTTRASENPENGDKLEPGSIEESDVRSLTVFLYADGDEVTSGVQMTKGSQIVAKGYTEVDGSSASNHPSGHGWEAEVTVQVTPGQTATLAGNSYGVLAVTNINGDGLTKVDGLTTVEAVANYLQKEFKTDKGFVMSTHMLKDESNHESVVKFPAVTDDQDIPEVEVFVERLAAKIRISPYVGTFTISNYTYNVGTDGDVVILNQAAVVNQLSSGSYLLKRATDKKNLLAELTIGETESDAGDVLLEDEEYSVEDEEANFVIDPWTRSKDVSKVFGEAVTWPAAKNIVPVSPEVNLAYGNHLMKKPSDKELNYGNWFGALSTSDEDLKAKDLKDASGQITLAYTMENTTNKDNSVHGFSTGVIFKATYYAKQLMDIQSDNKNVKPTSQWTDVRPEEALTFYTYGINQNKFKSYEAIFAYTLAKQVPEGSEMTSDEYYFYNSFMDDTWKTIKVSDFKKSKTYTDGAVDDPFGYIAYLKNILSSIEEADATMESASVQSFATFIGGKTFKDIKLYEKGECYYLTWMRHENNNAYNLIGPMEFVIVRNNIYDMSVSEIKSLGLAATDVPTPETPDESDKVYLNVTIKVKDWVVRSNGGIIL